eukprot:scaffold142280_cov32-Tisochrysis_lutea.AAC.3
MHAAAGRDSSPMRLLHPVRGLLAHEDARPAVRVLAISRKKLWRRQREKTRPPPGLLILLHGPSN